MNKSIINVNDNTTNMKVRDYTKLILANKNKMFRCEFVKKNGEKRVMKFVPRNSWNEQNAITTTEWGRNMVATKCERNMLTVCEFLGDGNFQPRTINLEKVISLSVC